jgi:hypothetical protein
LIFSIASVRLRHWHIRDWFPLDQFSAFWRATLAGMDHSQVE